MLHNPTRRHLEFCIILQTQSSTRIRARRKEPVVTAYKLNGIFHMRHHCSRQGRAHYVWDAMIMLLEHTAMLHVSVAMSAM
jgi:hypothetical protein